MAIQSIIYNRPKAVEYAHRWAMSRNPQYYDFSFLGGDCASFVSQCLYAGIGTMNVSPSDGWYYYSPNSRAPAWSGVKFLYDFLVHNKGAGPHAVETDLEDIQPGDVIQIATHQPDFHHTLLVVSVEPEPNWENTLIATHSYDSDYRPLASYDISKIRYLHITGGLVYSS